MLKVLDDRILVFDPPESNSVAAFQKTNLPMMGKKVKDIRFCFDRVFDESCGQEEVYDGSAKELVGHVMNGFHSTVFAYGATGCGKTHTISGSRDKPGIVFLIMKDLFARIGAKAHDTDVSLTVSYLEIYNETIRDLLAPESGQLQLREANGMAHPAGLSTKEPTCASDVVEWITLGNANRTVNATEANATSSRSHAVLRVTITQKPRAGGLTENSQSATLSVIDLAGSERASVTKNKGERLIEGANINRSLLALGNCINALCDLRKRGHVPYRDSKLTRLLKQSLGGNCKTVMIVCVSPSSAHYDETHNTLQYANRAKEIKTKAIRNVISVDRHVAQYCQQIMEQSQIIAQLKEQLAGQQGTTTVEDRDEDLRLVQSSLRQVSASFDSGRTRRTACERAAVEKLTLDPAIELLKRWRSTAFAGTDITAPGVSVISDSCDRLLGSLLSRSSQLAVEASGAKDAMSIFEPLVASQLKGLRANRPGAAQLFAMEVKVLETRLETAVAAVREGGIREGTKALTRALSAMSDARTKAGTALDQAKDAGTEAEKVIRHFVSAIDAANRDAFLGLAIGGSINNTTHNNHKRDIDARSPMYPQDEWAGHNPLSPRKSPRAASNGLGSAPSGPYALAQASPRARQSPKKGVRFPPQPARRASRSVSPKKPAKGLKWRDEVSEEDGLADYRSADNSLASEAMDSPAALRSVHAYPASPAGTSKLSSYAVPSASGAWSVSSTVSAGAASAAAAMAQAARARPAMGSLRAKATSRLSTLPPVMEAGKPFSFANDDSPAPAARRPFGDLANTSISSDGAGSSSFSGIGSSSAPPTPRTALANSRAARRVSNIGPQRSAKPSRRPSYAGGPGVPPTPTGKPALKASRMLGGTTFVVPGSARKSPKKATMRRLSTLPTSALGAAPTTVAAPFGLKSASRVAARRESTLGGGPAPARRDSPSGAPAVKAGVWR